MFLRSLTAIVLTLVVAAAAPAQVTVTGASGASIKQLAGSATLVTVILKESGARDANLKVLDINGSAINFLNASNEVIPYLVSDIDSVEVQGGVVEKTELKLDQSRALRPEEQLIFDRALSRARELYQESASNQEIKIEAATLLALNGDQDAIDYLVELALSNNINAQLSAALGLYLSGAKVPEDKLVLSDLIRRGLDSGNRQAKSQAAQLAGLVGDTSVTSGLLTLLQDRNPAQSSPAAIALARLGVRESIPQLLGMLEGRSEEKGDAAAKALVMLGGDDIIQQMNIQYPKAQGFGKFRIASVLYSLGSESGKKEINHFFREVYMLALDAAKLLAADGDFDAMSDLQVRLNERMDESEEGLIEYTEIATALLKGGDTTAQAILQQVLRKESVPARVKVCEGLVEAGNRRLMPLIQASLESRELKLSVEACATALALGNPEFRTRLVAERQG
jgi:HEAT repeat protein